MSVTITPNAATMVPVYGVSKQLIAALAMVPMGGPVAPAGLLNLGRPPKSGRVKTRFYRGPAGKQIAGRNETCPCGSGRKTKKCCR